MKLIILPLLIMSINIAEARVFKCPGEIDGRHTYQEKPCSNEKSAVKNNQLKIIPTNKKKVEKAVEKLNDDLKTYQAKKEKEANKNKTEIKVTLPPKDEPGLKETIGDEQPIDDSNSKGS